MATAGTIRLLAALLGLGVSLGACSGAHERRDSPPAHSSPAAAPAAILNLPALVGAPIDTLRRELGAAQPLPATFADSLRLASAQLGQPHDSLVLFRRANLTVIAAYDIPSGRVNELFLTGASEDALMREAGMALNAPGYVVLPVFRARRTTQLLGLRIIAQ